VIAYGQTIQDKLSILALNLDQSQIGCSTANIANQPAPRGD
jgi:hypothetical protein